MYKRWLLLFFICSYSFSFATKFITLTEEETTIVGKIIDKTSNKPLQDVSVTVLKDGVVFKGVLTDKKGKFMLSVPAGSYVLEIRFMGYKTNKQKFKIEPNQVKKDYGKVYLEEDISQLETVEIQSQTTSITDKIDKRVVHIGKDLAASGATALEVLENLPAVSVNNNKITYRGNPNVMIYIDGKPTSIQAENILDQIPANTIKDVELISNPSARYNPEGIGGIINIILRKNANLGFHANVASGITVGNRIGTNSSLNMNFKKGKINVFTNLGYNTKKKKSDGVFNYDFNGTTEEFVTLMDKESVLAKIGFDYYINKKNTFSFYTYQNFMSIDKNKDTDVDENNVLSKTKVSDFFDDRAKIYNLNYKMDFNKKGHSLELEVNFDTNTIEQKNENRNLSDPLSDFNFNDKIDIDRSFTIFNADYQNTLKSGLQLEIGAETRILKTDNDKQTNQINLTPNSLFEHNRNEYSFYTTVAKELGKKFSYKLGSRIEYYTFETILNQVPVFSKDYTNLYPSLHLNYTPNEKNYFKMGYSKHIFRPDVNELNPTNLWSSYTMTLTGNPQLKPTFVDYFELYYRRQLKKGSIILNPFYQINYNTVYQSISEDPNNPDRLILSYANSDIRRQYTLEYYFYYKLTKWWLFSFSGFATTLTEKGTRNNVPVNFKNNTLSASLGQRFSISPQFKIVVYANYNSKVKTLQLEKAAISKMDAVARYSFYKGKLNASLKFNDIFNSSGYSYIIDGSLHQSGQINLDTQSVYFALSYKFGGKPIKNRNRKEHEKQEINGGGIY